MRVVVADDSALLRDGISVVLRHAGLQPVAACGDAETLLRLVQEHTPHVAVVDVRMPPTHTTEGLDAARTIRAIHPGTAVLLLSQAVETTSLADLLEHGSAGVGYLLKDRIADTADFVDAVRRVAAGGTAVDPEVIARLIARRRSNDPLSALSAREREVLALMAQGQSNLAIARRLVLSERTVESHVRSILTRLDVADSTETHRRVQAVLTYLRSA